MRGRHTTIIEGLEPILKICHKNNIEVSPGWITTGLPNGRHLIKLKQLSGGVELLYRGSRTKQILHLYGDGEKIEELLKGQTKIPVI